MNIFAGPNIYLSLILKKKILSMFSSGSILGDKEKENTVITKWELK